ncbi:hypothetical protein B0J18DRAFT_419401 [Chaetomium sp. MPI-SDFR-AT-0129]|nr:hypothetical protein B0J18DRAFT_419401 [Chaetomium sp. MPI-SDFR-AT-0129]
MPRPWRSLLLRRTPRSRWRPRRFSRLPKALSSRSLRLSRVQPPKPPTAPILPRALSPPRPLTLSRLPKLSDVLLRQPRLASRPTPWLANSPLTSSRKRTSTRLPTPRPPSLPRSNPPSSTVFNLKTSPATPRRSRPMPRARNTPPIPPQRRPSLQPPAAQPQPPQLSPTESPPALSSSPS